MKKKQQGYLILLAFVIIGCLWAFIYAGIITKNFKEKLVDESLGKKQVSIQNLLVTQTKEGVKTWELFAEEGYYDNNNEVAILNDIVGNFYKDNKVVASFESARGTYNQVKNEIILYENSLIAYKDGSNVSADNISWAGKDSDITAKGNVRLEMPSKVIVYSEKAKLNSDFDKLEVMGRTKTEIYNKDNLKI